MNIDGINKINLTVHSCENLNSITPSCSRYMGTVPMTMKPETTQSILLITRDPSNEANYCKELLGWGNSFFKNHILEIFFRGYDKNKANKDKEYFDDFKERFIRLVYWTHYSKCFPGKKNGNHKQPNAACAKKFLDLEIELSSPDYIVLVGANSVKFVMKTKLLDAIHNNENNYKNNIPVICLTHPSGANNGHKKDSRYRYEETVEIIRKLIENIGDRNIDE